MLLDVQSYDTTNVSVHIVQVLVCMYYSTQYMLSEVRYHSRIYVILVQVHLIIKRNGPIIIIQMHCVGKWRGGMFLHMYICTYIRIIAPI